MERVLSSVGIELTTGEPKSQNRGKRDTQTGLVNHRARTPEAHSI